MNALYIARRIEKSTRSPRRLLLIIILLVLIAVILIAYVVKEVPTITQYGMDVATVPIIVPLEDEVCVGGTIRFPLIVFVDNDQVPGQINVAEAWCLAGLEGACFGVIPDRPDMPLLEPKAIISEATSRPVPLTLLPGVYHFWHSTTDANNQVSGYIVAPINVVDCKEKQP